MNRKIWPILVAFLIAADSKAQLGGTLGDVNQDGLINLLDVEPFIQVIIGAQPFVFEADINGDGVVDFLDAQPFMDILENPTTEGGGVVMKPSGDSANKKE